MREQVQVDLERIRQAISDYTGRPVHSCRLASSRRKLGKQILEFDADGRQYVGKVYRTDRSGPASFRTMRALWDAGFHSPSPFTVCAPVAYLTEYRMLLMEKAGGEPLSSLLFRDDVWHTAVADAAEWLAALHASSVSTSGLPFGTERIRTALNDFGPPLAKSLPEAADRIEGLTKKALLRLLEEDPSGIHVPVHGDYHPLNIYREDYRRLTVIDFDMFGWGERAMDVGYFLAQCAICGFLLKGDFASTQRQRDLFLRDYMHAAGEIDRKRLGIYEGIAFLQSLHYEFNVLHTLNTSLLEPWLAMSEQFLYDGDTDFNHAA